jgi:hypothetical protein
MEMERKKRKGKRVLYTKQRQWHIDPEVRFIDACVALGLVRKTVEPNKSARGREVVEVDRDTARREEDKDNYPTRARDQTQTLDGHVLHFS